MKRPGGKSKPTYGVLTNTVIPAKAGIQWPKSLITVLILSSDPLWTPAPYQVRGDVLSQERRAGLLIVNRLYIMAFAV